MSFQSQDVSFKDPYINKQIKDCTKSTLDNSGDCLFSSYVPGGPKKTIHILKVPATDATISK